MRIRAVVVLAAVGIVIGLAAGAAGAQDYPVEKGTLSIVGDDGTTGDGSDSPVPVEVGTEVRLQGGGFVPGSEVMLTIESEPIELGVTTADSAGEIDVLVSVPAGIEVGEHVVKASGEAAVGGRLVLELPVEVSDEPAEEMSDHSAEEMSDHSAEEMSDPPAAVPFEVSEPESGGSFPVLLVVVGIVAIAGGGFFAWSRMARVR